MRVDRLAVALSMAWASGAAAQGWEVKGGANAGLTYTDNFFFGSTDEQSALTFSVGPSVAASRTTEASSVSVLAGINANTVTGPPGNNNFWGGNLGLNADWQRERSGYGVNAFATRSERLQSAQQPLGVVLTRTTTSSFGAGASYRYLLAERWTASASAGVSANDYASAPPGSNLQDNRGYNLGGALTYLVDPRTTLTASAGYLFSSSDVTDSRVATMTLAAAHEFSPRLSVSASIAQSWTDIRTTERLLTCPGAAIQCQSGQLPFVPLTVGTERRDSGVLYGGSVLYRASERTVLSADLSESVQPSSVGSLNRIDALRLGVAHSFDDRLAGGVNAAYSRTTFPASVTGSFTNELYSAGASLSYRLGENWSVVAGVRYQRAEYESTPGAPRASSVFLTLQYGSPGIAFEPGLLGEPGVAPGPTAAPGSSPASEREEQPAGRAASATDPGAPK